MQTIKQQSISVYGSLWSNGIGISGYKSLSVEITKSTFSCLVICCILAIAKLKIMTTLKVGDKAPNFKALDEQGQTISLTDYKGKKLVVFFYPKANTPGCTVEACNLRDNYKVLKEKGYELLGVSADSQKKQANFKNKYNFPFPLLADEDKTVIQAFGVWGPNNLWDVTLMVFIE